MASNIAKGESQTLTNFYMKERRALSNAYGALAGAQNVATFAAFTFEDAVDQQIERIEGSGSQARPNLLTRVARIESQLLQAVESLRAVPPEQIVQPDPAEDVNTPE